MKGIVFTGFLELVEDKFGLEIVNQIIDSWNTPYTFDDLAFKTAVCDEIVINIKEVQRLW